MSACYHSHGSGYVSMSAYYCSHGYGYDSLSVHIILGSHGLHVWIFPCLSLIWIWICLHVHIIAHMDMDMAPCPYIGYYDSHGSGYGSMSAYYHSHGYGYDSMSAYCHFKSIIHYMVGTDLDMAPCLHVITHI